MATSKGRRSAGWLVLVGVALTVGWAGLTGCIGIRPVARDELVARLLADGQGDAWRGSQSGIVLHLRTCLEHEELLRWFDVDLAAVGVLPVVVEYRNGRQDEVNLGGGSFTLHTSVWRVGEIRLDELQRRLFRKYDVNLHTQMELDEFRAAFTALRPAATPLAPGGVNAGVILLDIAGVAPGIPAGASLSVSGARLAGRPVRLVFPLVRVAQPPVGSTEAGPGGKDRFSRE